MASFNLGISLAKPHTVVEGELEWWVIMTRNYIQQTDYQCWRIIEKGDEEVFVETNKKNWEAKSIS